MSSAFYEWVSACCFVSPRVSGNVDRLHRSFKDYTRTNEHGEFDLLACEFMVQDGFVSGVALAEDVEAFRSAYEAGDENHPSRNSNAATPQSARAKVDFLKRRAA